MWMRRSVVGVALFGLVAGCVFDPSGVTIRDLASRQDVSDGVAVVEGGGDSILDAVSLRDLPDLGPADLGPDLPPPLGPLAADDARLWLGLKSGGPLELWRYAASTQSWTVETSSPPATGEVHYVGSELLLSGWNQELAAVKAVSGGDALLTVHRHTPAKGWSTDLVHTVTGTASADKLDYDLVRERASGDLLLVYADGTKTPLFRCFSGGSWSAAAAVPINYGAVTLTSGAVLWVRLVPRAGTNTVALLYADGNADLGAVIWDGSQWDIASAKLLETDLKVNPLSKVVGNRCFDGAFESKTGDLLVVWGIEGDNKVRHAIRDAAASWGSPTTLAVYAGKTEFVQLAADPSSGSERIAAAFVDLGNTTERLGLGVWDGTGWVGTKEYDNTIHDVNDKGTGDVPAAVAWIGATGKAVCVYADSGTEDLSWYSWSAGSSDWVKQSDALVSGMSTTESVILRSLGTRDEVVAILSDDKSQLYAATGDGSSWTVAPGGPLTKALARTDAVPFSLAVQP